jgi:hypothetical protein
MSGSLMNVLSLVILVAAIVGFFVFMSRLDKKINK